jgi:hypothetical protein
MVPPLSTPASSVPVSQRPLVVAMEHIRAR